MKKEGLQDGELYESRFLFKERDSNFRFAAILLVLFILLISFRIWWVNSYNGVIVNGDSMQKTLQDNDSLLMSLVKKDGQAKRGDVIVVDVSGYEECSSVTNGFLIKRLIAIEGDKLYCQDGQIYICYQGSEEYVELNEPYAYYGANDANKHRYDFDTYEVGEGEVFFLGDNRSWEGSSIDSRYREKHGSHLENSLYKQADIYGVVPSWAIEYKTWLEKIFF